MGRRVLHVVATCLYTICRQEKSPHLLIDFSDALQINVYVLGKSYLQFSRSLNLKLPIVDPSLYIHRFAARLDLNEKLGAIITTALRIVTRYIFSLSFFLLSSFFFSNALQYSWDISKQYSISRFSISTCVIIEKNFCQFSLMCWNKFAHLFCFLTHSTSVD